MKPALRNFLILTLKVLICTLVLFRYLGFWWLEIRRDWLGELSPSDTSLQPGMGWNVGGCTLTGYYRPGTCLGIPAVLLPLEPSLGTTSYPCKLSLFNCHFEKLFKVKYISLFLVRLLGSSKCHQVRTLNFCQVDFSPSVKYNNLPSIFAPLKTLEKSGCW